MVTQSLAFVRTGRSEEMLLREDALLASDLAGASFPASDRVQFSQLVGARRTLYAQNVADLLPVYRGFYARDVGPQALAALAAAENRLISAGPAAGPGRVPAAAFLNFQQAFGAVSGGMSKASLQATTVLVARADAASHGIYVRLFVVGGLGLLAVILSILVSVFVGRGLVRELAALRESARDLAERRLPDVLRRLHDGEDVDAAEDAPAVAAKTTEIRQVGEAFGTVRQTAVQAAVGEARLRRGVNDIFRNLARRSQSLLHRQLSLLDAMERRAAEPEELEDLFRIDHLTTRMRRHAESLIILSGDAPARGWRNPVPMVDVLRAGVAEVEDYTRIRVITSTRAALAGPAVGDVIHIVAELAENAAIFSPPNTPVLIGGDTVGRGFAIEIEDRGLGLTEEKRAELNALLASPPPFDLSGSDQLGLFVAGQLAKRHNVQISLRPSPYGGTTAIVLIPVDLVVPEGAYDRDAAAAGQDEHAIRLTGRHAARADDSAGAPRPAPVPAGPAPAAMPPAAGPGGGDPQYAADAIWPDSPDSPESLAGDPASTADLTELDLPRRIRQASLAPQLRDAAARADPAPGDPADDASGPAGERSPAEAGAAIAAIQQGWQRGRSVFDPADQPAAAGPGRTPKSARPATTGIPGRSRATTSVRGKRWAERSGAGART